MGIKVTHLTISLDEDNKLELTDCASLLSKLLIEFLIEKDCFQFFMNEILLFQTL